MREKGGAGLRSRAVNRTFWDRWAWFYDLAERSNHKAYAGAAARAAELVPVGARVLKNSRLVKFRKDGKTVFYSLADDHVRKIIAQGMEHVNE